MALTSFQRQTHSVGAMIGRLVVLVAIALIAAPAFPQDASAPCRLCDSAAANTPDNPAERIELVGLAGGSIRLESIRSDLSPMPRLDGEGRLSFRFGGILRVSGDLDGEFRGDVPIDVEYF